jgi:hypothetical protein
MRLACHIRTRAASLAMAAVFTPIALSTLDSSASAATVATTSSFSYNCFGYWGTFKSGSHVRWADWDGNGIGDECFGISPDRRIYHAWWGHPWVEMPNGGRADDVVYAYVVIGAGVDHAVRVHVNNVGDYCSVLYGTWYPWVRCTEPEN